MTDNYKDREQFLQQRQIMLQALKATNVDLKTISKLFNSLTYWYSEFYTEDLLKWLQSNRPDLKTADVFDAICRSFDLDKHLLSDPQHGLIKTEEEISKYEAYLKSKQKQLKRDPEAAAPRVIADVFKAGDGKILLDEAVAAGYCSYDGKDYNWNGDKIEDLAAFVWLATGWLNDQQTYNEDITYRRNWKIFADLFGYDKDQLRNNAPHGKNDDLKSDKLNKYTAFIDHLNDL